MRRLIHGLLLAGALASLSGCIIYPSPWHAWRYEEVIPPGRPLYREGGVARSPSYFQVEHGLLRAYLVAHDETRRTGGPPYRFQLWIEDASGQTREVRVHGIEVTAGAGQRSLSVVPAPGRSYPFPVPLTDPSQGRRPARVAWFRPPSSLDLRPTENERVTIKLDLEFVGPWGGSRQTHSLEFQPKAEYGWFNAIGIVD